MKITLLVLIALLSGGCATIQAIIERLPDIPTPEQPEPDKPAPPVADEFPAGTRWIYGPDISSWPTTIPLHSARIYKLSGAANEAKGYHRLVVNYSHLQTLPAWYQNPDPKGYNRHNVNGTVWILREFQGRWIMGSVEYLKVGQTAKDIAILPEYQIEAKSGEPFWVMVSTTSREWDGTRVDGDPRSPYRERSNLVKVLWP